MIKHTGSKTYQSTEPCMHGHVNPLRYIKGHGCVQCVNGRKRLTPEDKEARKANRVNYRQTPQYRAKMDALFLSRLDRSGGAEACWPYTGYINENGYGYASRDGTPDVAHRVAYRLLAGPIPDGLHLDHSCRNRACCNPKHLHPMTNKENLARGEGLPARLARRTHCKQGHEYNEKNTRIAKYGRVCRICERARATGKLRGGVFISGKPEKVEQPAESWQSPFSQSFENRVVSPVKEAYMKDGRRHLT